MNVSTNNPSPEAVEAVRAHVEQRALLLASCARGVNALNNSATAWAYAEGRAIRAGLTDLEAVQRAACEKFPKVTGNGKVSKTPNSGFKTSFDRFVLVHMVASGEHKTYASAQCVAVATRFLSDDNQKRNAEGEVTGYRLTLNDAETQIKAVHAAEGREARANETDADKAARKVREAAETATTVAGIVINDGATMLALASRIAGMEAEEAEAFRQPLTKLMEACEAAITLANAALPAEPVQKAA